MIKKTDVKIGETWSFDGRNLWRELVNRAPRSLMTFTVIGITNDSITCFNTYGDSVNSIRTYTILEFFDRTKEYFRVH